MKNYLFLSILIVTVLTGSPVTGQSKKELRKQIATLTTQKDKLEAEIDGTKAEKESLKTKLDRISNIQVDDVITPAEQPKDVVIGESGWRVELNGSKYKSDLIGQLGTVWILDINNQLQPQGAISLTDYKIEPIIINPDKEIIYKTFISKGTKLEGAGGAPFASITAGLTNEQFSNFTINIEGTSLIKPKIPDLKKIAQEANDIFTIAGNKGVFICTGMHVIRYHSRIYSKSEGNAKITSPMINIGGNFFGESNEESSEYLVIRQITQLIKQSSGDTLQVISKIREVANSDQSSLSVSTEAKKYSPEELLMYFLNRQPSTEEIIQYQNDSKAFLTKLGKLDGLNVNEKNLLETTNKKLVKLPKELTTKDQ
jgi:hypothetical protein